MNRVLIGMALLMAACGQKQTDVTDSVEENLRSYLDRVAKIETPFLIQEGTIVPAGPVTMDDPAISDTLRNYLYGKIFESDDYYGLIYSVPVSTFTPILRTVDKKGKQIDELQLLGELGSAGDNESMFKESARIFSEDLIVLTDSVFSWKINDVGERIQESQKIQVVVEKYRITAKGKIERIK